jgi:hypothetical protein
MEGVASLDNSVGAKIHEARTVSLDCLVEAGSHNISLDDLHLGLYMLEKGSYLH